MSRFEHQQNEVAAAAAVGVDLEPAHTLKKFEIIPLRPATDARGYGASTITAMADAHERDDARGNEHGLTDEEVERVDRYAMHRAKGLHQAYFQSLLNIVAAVEHCAPDAIPAFYREAKSNGHPSFMEAIRPLVDCRDRESIMLVLADRERPAALAEVIGNREKFKNYYAAMRAVS